MTDFIQLLAVTKGHLVQHEIFITAQLPLRERYGNERDEVGGGSWILVGKPYEKTEA